MNRIISAIVFTAALGGLTACSSNNDNNDGGSPSASGSPTTGGSGTADTAGGAAGNGGASPGTGTQTADGSGANGPDGTGGAGTGGTNAGSPGGSGVVNSGGGAVDGGGTSAGGSGSGASGSGGGGTSVPAQNISNAPAANAEIATDAGGNALAVWQQHDGTRNNIYYSRFSGGSWSAPALLENLDGDTTKPDVATNSAGNAIAVWTQPNPGGGSSPSANWTWARVFSPTSGWGPPVVVSNAGYREYDGPFSDNATAAIDDSGIGIALWEDSSLHAVNISLAANIYRPGSGWETSRLLHRSWTYRADIAMDGHGNAVVGYLHDGGNYDEAHALTFSATAGWSGPTKIFSGSGGDSRVSVGMDAAGNALLTAVHFGYPAAPKSGIYFSRWTPGGTWSAPVNLDYQTGVFDNVDLAVAANGNAVVLWQQRQTMDSAPQIYGARYENFAWQLPLALGPGSNPRTAMAGAGPFATFENDGKVMWTRWNGSGWNAPLALESSAEPSSSPRVAGSTYAQPFFVWLQPSGVWARRLP